jgi:hypothetical protein
MTLSARTGCTSQRHTATSRLDYIGGHLMIDGFTEAFIGVRIGRTGDFAIKIWVRGVMRSSRTHGRVKGMSL